MFCKKANMHAPDTHGKIAAVLHIILGTFCLLAVLFVTLFVGGTAYFANIDFPFAGLIASLGAIVVGLFALYGLAQVGSGIAYLRGSDVARVLLIIFSVLQLFNFPIGTAIGAYSLWALLRNAEPRRSH